MNEIIKIIVIVAVVLAELWMILKANKVFNFQKKYKEKAINVNSGMFLWLFIIWTAMMGGGTIMEVNNKSGIMTLFNLWWILLMGVLWNLVRKNIIIIKENSILIELSREISFSNIRNVEIREGKKGAKVLTMVLRDNNMAYIPARDEYEANRIFKLIKNNI